MSLKLSYSCDFPTFIIFLFSVPSETMGNFSPYREFKEKIIAFKICLHMELLPLPIKQMQSKIRNLTLCNPVLNLSVLYIAAMPFVFLTATNS
jgi:hypothetical protein